MKIKKYYIVFAYLALLSLNSSVFANIPSAASDNSQQTGTNNGLSTKDVQRFGEAIQLIKNYYVDSVSDQKLFEGAIRGMLESLDPHSSYLNSDDLKSLKDLTTGEFSGLGIEVMMSASDDYLKVISPLDGGPAQKAGIKSGDIIVMINGTPVKGLTIQEAVKKMRGKKGTTVVLTVVRKGEDKPLKFNLVRDDIRISSVTSRLLEDGYGYVRISSFQTGTATMLEQAVSDLKRRSWHGQLKGIVLDLRNDPGGLLDAAVQVADDFIDMPKSNANNLIVYTKSRLPGSELKINATPGDILNNAPIVVLINEGSASASEIVAGALQDHKRAIIAGSNSFGKGSVQTVIPLGPDSAIKLTTALYYTPLGRSIQAKGIQPDIMLGDFKLMPANDKTQSLDLKESDLMRHLNNPGNINNTSSGSISSDFSSKIPELPSSLQLAIADYQVFEALNLLKEDVMMQDKKNVKPQ